ncbi:MAG: phospholipase D-like domain-containing protein [Steroidobacteraceae bacterium]
MASSTPNTPAPVRPRRRLRWLLGLVLLAWAGIAEWNTHKPLPAGVHVAGPWQPVNSGEVRLLFDMTSGERRHRQLDQEIFAATLALIASSRDLLVLDYFLFNGQHGPSGDLRYEDGIQPLARQLREALLARHRAEPAMPMLVLVDPINSYYERPLSPDLATLRAAGIEVVTTRLDALRDSNFLYSALWRLGPRWLVRPGAPHLIPNVLDAGGPKMSAGAALRLLNFKANHRKLLITGDGRGSLRGIITSANPHDASSAHSNVAVELAGAMLAPLLQSELDIARLSGWPEKSAASETRASKLRAAAAATTSRVVAHKAAPPVAVPQVAAISVPERTARATVLTEGAIRDALLERLADTGPQDAVDIAMFYLSDRDVIDALVAASARGTRVRLILDPNRDAFGFEKSGLPNRPAAAELQRRSNGKILIRWYRTHGEQFHAKIAAVYGPGRMWILAGSSNFTRRNLRDYNLEADVALDLPSDAVCAMRFSGWFQTLWDGPQALGAAAATPAAIVSSAYTTDFASYAEDSALRYWLYRIMEASGLSTF